MVEEISDKLASEIKTKVNEADKVVVGIGLEWMAKVESADSFPDVLIDEKEHEKYKELYSKLKTMLGGKDYYILTLCYDDLIYEVFGEEDNVVAPCGGYNLLQCDKHIMTKDEVKVDAEGWVCPVCGGKLSHNNIENPQYMEEGYLGRFADYKQWLQSTINKKLLILELGADMKYLGVIRFAFDRLCQYNLKSDFYRINKMLFQHAAESGSRGISVNGDSRDLISLM